MKTPLVLMILDGWGVGREWDKNPIFLAPTPNIDNLLANYPSTEIAAAEEGVGLPPGHQGSSEIGHYIIGAGRNALLPQEKVMLAGKTGEIFSNDAYVTGMDNALKNGSAVHLMGLLSEEGVHAYDQTCFRLMELAKKKGVGKVYIHVFTDGRDVPPKTAGKFLSRLEEKIKELGIGEIATVMGRYFAMDRDHRFERTEKAWRAIALSQAEYQAASAWEAVERSYEHGKTDEFIEPTLIMDKNGNPVGRMQDNDSVIFWNFRIDRAIQLSQAFVEDEFEGFTRERRPRVFFVATSEYYQGLDAPVAFFREQIPNNFAEVLSAHGLKQLRIAETEKWVYFTTIFNSMREEPYPGEDRILIPSDKIATYDLAPEMKAKEIAEKAAEEIAKGEYDFVGMNFANPDILGHTGKQEAIKQGIAAVDRAVGIVLAVVRGKDGVAIITADHGNPEVSWDEGQNQPHTYHTTSKVPFIVYGSKSYVAGLELKDGGALRDVAPTMLSILDIAKPKEMTGQSLLIER